MTKAVGKLRGLAVLYSLLGMVFLWWLLSIMINRPILPSPKEVSLALFREMATGEVLGHFLWSLYRVLAGTALAVLTAVPIGLILGQSERADKAFSPVIYILYPIPKVVFLPIIILFFGPGDLSKILIISLILFFQTLVLVRDLASAVNPQLVRSVRSLGASLISLQRFVYLPAVLPGILTGLRQGIGTSVAVLYVAELFVTTKGLGYYIYLTGSTMLDYPAMYGGVLLMGFLGLGLYLIIDWAEKRMCPWKFVK